MKILSVVGARPQFVKAAAVSRVLRRRFDEVLVHTGQHYDYGMSEIFFDELEIPKADYNLAVGSKGHGAQTGEMLARIEELLLKETPAMVLVYGDTNSTLGGALAAAKLHIPLAHVEAGLRSFKKAMPEEVNRVLTDHVSSLLFAPTDQAVKNLAREGITGGVCRTGDVMCDALRHYEPQAAASGILERLSLEAGTYILATIHRAENTDDPDRLRAILEALAGAGERVVLPLHPRTRHSIEGTHAAVKSLMAALTLIEPTGYIDMLGLERSARAIVTDSGGVQKEAFMFNVPCITVRDETEWVETVDAGANTLTGARTADIVTAIRHAFRPAAPFPPLYGDGHAADAVVANMAAFLEG
jgi:UDP-N-acetylglucosamine 2-epimerase